MPPSIFFVTAFYPEFVKDLYESEPALADLDYKNQKRRLLDTRFSAIDAYRAAFEAAGCRVDVAILYADQLLARWADETGVTLHGNIHDRRRQFVTESVARFRPDILYVFEWAPLGDEFLAEIKKSASLLAGQIASPLRPDRTYDAYDLMVSSWPPIVDYFHEEGKPSAYVKLAFDERVLDRPNPGPPCHDVTFVGGFAPSHPNRVAWLERLLGEVDIDVFGYGLEQVPHGSPIRARHRGPAWGYRMYDVLQRSRLTLNMHAMNDVRGTVVTNVANNMRLYEATGVGSCLLTDAKDNMREMLETDREVLVYRSEAECVEKIRYYLDHERERATIASAGQQRTLRDHTYSARVGELLEILRQHLPSSG